MLTFNVLRRSVSKCWERLTFSAVIFLVAMPNYKLMQKSELRSSFGGEKITVMSWRGGGGLPEGPVVVVVWPGAELAGNDAGGHSRDQLVQVPPQYHNI
jgi:hypothetical protein